MNNIQNQSKLPSASVIAALLTLIFVTTVTVVADLLPPLKTWLASTFTHHWIGKGAIAAGVFVFFLLAMLLFGKAQEDETLAAQIKLLNIVTALGAIVIFLFFVYEALLK